MFGKYAAIIGAAAFGFFGATLAHAESWNEETLVTFRAPVEIQGKTLPAGAYLFRLREASYVRGIVEVLSPDESHSYGLFMTFPDYTLKPPDRTHFTFDERPAGSPEAVKVWFCRDDHFGRQFTYPGAKHRRRQKGQEKLGTR